MAAPTRRSVAWRLARALGYLWAAPTSALGLLLVPAALLGGGAAGVVRGVLEVHGGAVTWLLRRLPGLPGGAAALTLGHVVLGVDRRALDVTRAHERVHVAQCARWGPLFVPAYLLASLWVVLRGGRAHRDNPFERAAFARSGDSAAAAPPSRPPGSRIGC